MVVVPEVVYLHLVGGGSTSRNDHSICELIEMRFANQFKRLLALHLIIQTQLRDRMMVSVEGPWESNLRRLEFK